MRIIHISLEYRTKKNINTAKGYEDPVVPLKKAPSIANLVITITSKIQEKSGIISGTNYLFISKLSGIRIC